MVWSIKKMIGWMIDWMFPQYSSSPVLHSPPSQMCISLHLPEYIIELTKFYLDKLINYFLSLPSMENTIKTYSFNLIWFWWWNIYNHSSKWIEAISLNPKPFWESLGRVFFYNLVLSFRHVFLPESNLWRYLNDFWWV